MNKIETYNKSVYVFRDGQPKLLHIRNYTSSDIEQLINLQRECFPPPYPADLLWNREQLLLHIERFPTGALCAEIDGQIVGSLTAMMTTFDPNHMSHSWAEMTDDGNIGTHEKNGDTLYVVDISVSPSARGLGLGKQMLQATYELVVALKLQRLLGGGRMPGYGAVQHEVSPEHYVDDVLHGKRRDPVIGFLLHCGRTPVAVLPDYLDDEESGNYALLMEWRNPFLQTSGT
ncbi:GNAT family N-acetyltransferase [Saccharibacillus sp. JS10]|uniref:GNAT family N-acetyltransferase n=1 Tax=Saccharibacillus sp. JS10 TaxID=2950552 RepID=UPI00210A81D3|nr:GNAT family N-acetyltransferase [Saccharibacillus sp. JS10]MCQ4087380.1 GNAT family N-acetyltransferase [Saccharibacillus sp. JS10]